MENKETITEIDDLVSLLTIVDNDLNIYIKQKESLLAEINNYEIEIKKIS